MSSNPALLNAIREEIQASPESAISFRRFMELSLYHPEQGYYSSSSSPIGRGGDFFTSVSVGECFGRLLAEWIRNAEPEKRVTVIEQGANDGQLAADILSHRPNVDYCIVEPLTALRERLRNRFSGEQVRVVAGLADLALTQPALFLCNELVDAFPVHRVRFGGGEWREIYVSTAFEEELRPLSDPRLTYELESAPQIEGYTAEVNLSMLGWIRELAAHLPVGSQALVIDYGFGGDDDHFAPERSSGTLRGYRSHQPLDDPYTAIGNADLTTHVDFPRLAQAARKAGFASLSLVDQHHFLIPLARQWFAEIEQSGHAPSPENQKLLRQFQTLTHPSMMGQSFKVLQLVR